METTDLNSGHAPNVNQLLLDLSGNTVNATTTAVEGSNGPEAETANTVAPPTKSTTKSNAVTRSTRSVSESASGPAWPTTRWSARGAGRERG